ncbi:MAG: hypothetical protein MK095_06780, partial [Phycisphaerales bacterium]|nr:hypothetical protein [Phycisphaerales bacterium]
MNTFICRIVILLTVLACAASASALQEQEAPEPTVKSIPDVALNPYLGNHTFRRPVQAVVAPGDAETVYVVEQAGRIIAMKNAQEASKPRVVLDIKDAVHDKHNEEGLLSLAFHPKHAENG